MNEDDKIMIKIIIDQDIEFYAEFMAKVKQAIAEEEVSTTDSGKMKLYCTLELVWIALKQAKEALYKEESWTLCQSWEHL